MSNKISELVSGGAVSATDKFPAVETSGVGPVTKTGSQLRVWAQSAAADPLNLAQYSDTTDCTAALQAAIDACFGTAASPHSSANAKLNKPFILPPGQFNITSPLVLTKVRGGLIKGAGRWATNITNTAGGNVFNTNGFEYSRVEGMQLAGSGSAVLFNLDWDNSSGTALQSNTFADMFFSAGAYGVAIGSSGFMGSENLFLNCFFGGNTAAGLYTGNFNALQNTVIGGNFQNCGKGIWVQSGSVPNIIGVGFQLNTQDIQIDNTSNDAYTISSCRTEGANFLLNTNGAKASLVGCAQLSSTSGVFARCNSPTILDCCFSQNGQIDGNQYGYFNIRGSTFGRPDIVPNTSGITYIIDGNINAVQTHGSSLTLDFNNWNPTLFEMTSSSATTITIPPNSSVTLPVGIAHEVYQLGTGQVTIASGTGVTIRTPRSLTTRAQYSTIRMKQRAIDEWVLSGDLT